LLIKIVTDKKNHQINHPKIDPKTFYKTPKRSPKNHHKIGPLKWPQNSPYKLKAKAPRGILVTIEAPFLMQGDTELKKSLLGTKNIAPV
jgi:hypothetical protein